MVGDGCFVAIYQIFSSVLVGLIIGVIIKYGSSGTVKSTEVAGLAENTSYGPDHMPDQLLLKVPVPNTTDTQYWQYSCRQQIQHNVIEEKEFEEKVSTEFGIGICLCVPVKDIDRIQE